MRVGLLAPLLLVLGPAGVVGAAAPEQDPTPTPSPEVLGLTFDEVTGLLMRASGPDPSPNPWGVMPVDGTQQGAIEDPPGDAFNYVSGPSDGPAWVDLVRGGGYTVPGTDPSWPAFRDQVVLPLCQDPDSGAVCHQTFDPAAFDGGMTVFWLNLNGGVPELGPGESAYFAVRGFDGVTPAVPDNPIQQNSPFTGANNFYRYDIVDRRVQFFLWNENQFAEFASSVLVLPAPTFAVFVVPTSELRMVDFDVIVDHTVAPNLPNGDILGADANQRFPIGQFALVQAPAATATPTPEATATPAATPTATPEGTPTPDATATPGIADTTQPAVIAPPPTTAAGETAAEDDDDGSGFPWWILIVAGLVLLALAIWAVARRRRDEDDGGALAGAGAVPIDDKGPAPTPPKVGKKAPKAYKEFVRCKIDDVLVEPGPITWLSLPFGSPDASFEHKPGGGGVRATVSMATTVVLDVTVVDGHLSTTVVDAGILGEGATDAIRDWTNSLNAVLDHEGKQLDALELKDGKLHMTKRRRPPEPV